MSDIQSGQVSFDSNQNINNNLSQKQVINKLLKIKKKNKKNNKKKRKRPLKFTSSTYKKQKCQFYNKGNCIKGQQCTYNHDFVPDTTKKICKYFLSGACTKDNLCQYSHDSKIYPCKYFHIDNYCGNMNNCRFSHEPIPQDFYSEYMKDNKQHILKAYKQNKNLSQELLQIIQEQIPKKIQNMPIFIPQINSKSDLNKKTPKKDPRMSLPQFLLSKQQRQIYYQNTLKNSENIIKQPQIKIQQKVQLFKQQQKLNINQEFKKQLKMLFYRYY